MTVYTFLFASAAILPFIRIPEVIAAADDWNGVLAALGLGIGSTLLSFLLYTYGLREVESSKSSILATVEPVVAALIGVVLFQEVLSLWQLAGVILVLTAVILAGRSKEKQPRKVSLYYAKE